MPIVEYQLSGANALEVGIDYSSAYKEINACVEAGLDYSKWVGGEYTPEVMGAVLAWYDVKHLIEAHVSDEEAKQAKKNTQKGKK